MLKVGNFAFFLNQKNVKKIFEIKKFEILIRPNNQMKENTIKDPRHNFLPNSKYKKARKRSPPLALTT